jgi:flagellar export protein FliJ
MKRFRFPLDTLLALRRRKLEKHEAELAALQRRHAAYLQTAADLERRSAEARASIPAQASIRGADLRLIDASSQAMLEQAQASRESAGLLARDLAQARQAVLSARRNAEALEKLREQGLEQWRRAAAREEEALAAELYLARMRK